MPSRKYTESDPLDDIPTRSVRATRSSRTASKRMASKRSADRIRSTPSRSPKPTEDSAEWEASNVRVTFYCPKTLLRKVEHEIRRSGRSKTRVIVDAIE